MTDPAGTGTGKDPTSSHRTLDAEEDVPAVGEGRLGPPDPAERGLPADDVAGVEEQSGFYGAGEPAAEAPPLTSSRFPASTAATGVSRPGDQVTGIEDGPVEELTAPTTPAETDPGELREP